MDETEIDTELDILNKDILNEPEIEIPNININQNENKNNKDNIIINQTKMEPDKVIEHLSRIIKDPFDGDPTQLDPFINKIELAKLIIGDNHPNIFISYIKSRLTNKALEATTQLNSIQEIINTLKSKIKPESSRVIENRLLQLRVDNKNKLEFSKEAESMAEMLRLALIAEKIPNDVAKDMIIRKTIEMSMANARSDRIKSILSAKTFNTTAEVVSALLIQFRHCQN